jgi:hypothetical protein
MFVFQCIKNMVWHGIKRKMDSLEMENQLYSLGPCEGFNLLDFKAIYAPTWPQVLMALTPCIKQP